MFESQGLPKVWIPAPNMCYADCTGSVKGVWIYPWQDVCWHVEHRGMKSFIVGYTIVTRTIREEIYNV